MLIKPRQWRLRYNGQIDRYFTDVDALQTYAISQMYATWDIEYDENNDDNWVSVGQMVNLDPFTDR